MAVKSIKDVNTISFGMVDAYLLTCETPVLVDTGFSQGNGETILKKIEEKGLDPNDVELCIITHNHGDHIGGLSVLKESCNFRVASHVGDAGVIESRTGVKVDLLLEGGEILPYCGGIEIIHVPGHTKGNISLYLKEKKAIIVGDTLFAQGGELTPPPERYCEDVNMATRELKRLLNYDFEALLISHGEDILENAKNKLKKVINKVG